MTRPNSAAQLARPQTWMRITGRCKASARPHSESSPPFARPRRRMDDHRNRWRIVTRSIGAGLPRLSRSRRLQPQCCHNIRAAPSPKSGLDAGCPAAVGRFRLARTLGGEQIIKTWRGTDCRSARTHGVRIDLSRILGKSYAPPEFCSKERGETLFSIWPRRLFSGRGSWLDPGAAALDGVDYAFPPHSSAISARMFELEAAGRAIVLRMTRA